MLGIDGKTSHRYEGLARVHSAFVCVLDDGESR